MDVINCSSLAEVRSNIDKIDKEIVLLLSQRGEYVKQATKFKKTSSDITNTKRVEQIIRNVVKHAKELDFDTVTAEDIYRHLIDAFIKLEERTFNKQNCI